MGYLPSKDTRFSGTETLTNLTANSGGTIDLDAATSVTVPTVTANGAGQEAINDAAMGTYITAQLASYATTSALEAAIAGMDIKASVRAATTSALSITGRTSTTLTIGGTTFTLDGISMANGDRVLVKDSTTGTGSGTHDNGIYTVGGVGTSIVLTRSTDADSWTELPGAIVAVEVGTTNADRVYLITSDQGGTLGTTAITVTGFGIYVAGTGITLTGSTFALDTSYAMTLGTSQTVTGVKTFTSTGVATARIAMKETSDVNNRFEITADGDITWRDPSAGGTDLQFSRSGSTITVAGTWDFSSATTTVGTASAGDNDTSAASTAFVQRDSRRKAMVVVADASFPYTLTASGSIPTVDVIVTNQTASSRNIVLCAANAVSAGTVITVKDASASGAGTYNFTITRAGSDTIDGLTTFTVDTNLQSVDLMSDGSSKWYIV